MRIVQFYTNQTGVPLKKTIQYFRVEKIARSSIFRIIDNYNTGKTVNRKAGGGRRAKIMAMQMKSPTF